MHFNKAGIISLFVSMLGAGILACCKKQESSLSKTYLTFGNMHLESEIILYLILLMEWGMSLFYISTEIAGSIRRDWCKILP